MRTDSRVVLLAPHIHPYRVPLFEALEENVGELRILVSALMQPSDPRPPEWDHLGVEVQHRFELRRTWQHPSGFQEQLGIHIPYDTWWRLWRYRPDVILTTEMGPRTIQAVLYRLVDRRSRVVIWATVSEQNERGRGLVRTLARRWLLRRSDAVLVNGESGARYVKRFGVEERNLHRVPYTAATRPPAEPRAWDEGLPDRMLYIGQLIPRKGLPAFLDAVERWCLAHTERRLELCIVGEGPQQAELEDRSRPENLEMRFLGAVPNDRVGEIFAQADIFAFPTLSDEWGVVVNEAMTAGVPVLGSVYSQAVEELVTDGEHGWVFRPDDATDMQKAVERALQSPREQLAAMGQAAQQVIRDLSPEAVAERIAQAVRIVATDLRHPRDA